MRALLKKADLENHGFKKEVITSLKSDPGSTNPVYEKKYLYYKTVDCSQAQDVVQELQTLLPGNCHLHSKLPSAKCQQAPKQKIFN